MQLGTGGCTQKADPVDNNLLYGYVSNPSPGSYPTGSLFTGTISRVGPLEFSSYSTYKYLYRLSMARTAINS